MLTQEATPAMVKEWKKIYDENRDSLTPNRKTGKEIEDYLRTHYTVVSINTEEANRVVTDNILNNQVFKEKLSRGVMPSPVTYYVGDDKVFVGIDLVSGYIHVEGSVQLYDELFAYRGLDEVDLNNIFLVAEYVKCTKR